MNPDLILLFVCCILVLVIVFLLIERAKLFDQFKTKEDKLLDENSRLVKAVIAKNANDYVMTTSIDKVVKEEKEERDPDLVSEDEMTDEEFMRAIDKRNEK